MMLLNHVIRVIKEHPVVFVINTIFTNKTYKLQTHKFANKRLIYRQEDNIKEPISRRQNTKQYHISLSSSHYLPPFQTTNLFRKVFIVLCVLGKVGIINTQ